MVKSFDLSSYTNSFVETCIFKNKSKVNILTSLKNEYSPLTICLNNRGVVFELNGKCPLSIT